MNEKYKAQWKLLECPNFSLKVFHSNRCYEASLFYHCYHCSRCFRTGSSCPRCMCTLSSKILFLIFFLAFMQLFCCPSPVGNEKVTGGKPYTSDGGIICNYKTFHCAWVSTEVCFLRWNMSHPVDRPNMQSSLQAVVRRVQRVLVESVAR